MLTVPATRAGARSTSGSGSRSAARPSGRCARSTPAEPVEFGGAIRQATPDDIEAMIDFDVSSSTPPGRVAELLRARRRRQDEFETECERRCGRGRRAPSRSSPSSTAASSGMLGLYRRPEGISAFPRSNIDLAFAATRDDVRGSGAGLALTAVRAALGARARLPVDDRRLALGQPALVALLAAARLPAAVPPPLPGGSLSADRHVVRAVLSSPRPRSRSCPGRRSPTSSRTASTRAAAPGSSPRSASRRGGLVHVAAATVGLSALIASSATAFTVVKLVGAVYLIVVGIRRILAGRDATEQSRGAARAAAPALPPGRDRQRASTRRRRCSSSPSCRSSSTRRAASMPPQVALLGAHVRRASRSRPTACTRSLAAALAGASAPQRARRDGSGAALTGGVFVALGVTAAAARAQHVTRVPLLADARIVRRRAGRGRRRAPAAAAARRRSTTSAQAVRDALAVPARRRAARPARHARRHRDARDRAAVAADPRRRRSARATSRSPPPPTSSSGSASRGSTILVAGGLLRRTSPREIGLLVPPEFRRRFRGRVIVHDAEAEDLVELGAGRRRSRCASTRALVETDLVVHGDRGRDRRCTAGPAALLAASGRESLRAAARRRCSRRAARRAGSSRVELERLLAERVAA